MHRRQGRGFLPASLKDANRYQETLYRLLKWRRRESNLHAISPQPKMANALAKTAEGAALHMRCTWSASKVVCWHRLTLNCSAS